MNSCELTASITAIANAIACNRTMDEINLLGVALTQLGGYTAYHCNTEKYLL